MITLTERQAEVLSYLMGIAPIRTPFQVQDKWLSQDLPHLDRGYIRSVVCDLEAKGAVERLVIGIASTSTVLRVLKRLEAYTVKPSQTVVKRRPLIGYAGREAA